MAKEEISKRAYNKLDPKLEALSQDVMKEIGTKIKSLRL